MKMKVAASETEIYQGHVLTAPVTLHEFYQVLSGQWLQFVRILPYLDSHQKLSTFEFYKRQVAGNL